MSNAVGHAIREEVVHQLRQIEGAQGVRFFYACESGSRAWGFPSKDSDYDVRFLYAHPRIATISDFIEEELERLETKHVDAETVTSDVEGINRFFREALDELWLAS